MRWGWGGGEGEAVPASLFSSQSVASLWHLLGDAQLRAITDVRFASSLGKARCLGSQPRASPPAPLPAPMSTEAPGQERKPTWWLAVSEAAVACPLLHCYHARSAMFLVSAGARRATTTGWVGARGAGASGRGRWAESRFSTLHPSLAQQLSMPSSPTLPLGLSTRARSCSGFSWQPEGGKAVAAAGGGGGAVWRGVGSEGSVCAAEPQLEKATFS